MSPHKQESFLMGSIVVDTDDLFVAKAVSDQVRAIPIKDRSDNGSLMIGDKTVQWWVLGKRPAPLNPV